MWDKLKNDKFIKMLLSKLITVLVVASIALLLFDVLTKSNDGRRQIVDEDGGSEYIESEEDLANSRQEARLKDILSDIKGVGDVDVMITYKKNEKTASVFNEENNNRTSEVEGVIVTARGAENIIIKNSISNAVTAVFNIPSSNVVVFEKN
ncbi:hypothetical protein [Anaerovorax odorimutans]|uniref:hypothetical protein n=1 Tax=Anaerovorax odorimutans TaxID=109327 RepID=UPI000414BFCD|nr:hypothetical protein [Anaerovorax odorimutans]